MRHGVLERRQHPLQGFDLRGGTRTRDGLLGNQVHGTYARRGDERDGEEHRRHVQKRTFHLRACFFTPKRLGFTYLSISGTTAFMMRIANDMPSG